MISLSLKDKTQDLISKGFVIWQIEVLRLFGYKVYYTIYENKTTRKKS